MVIQQAVESGVETLWRDVVIAKYLRIVSRFESGSPDQQQIHIRDRVPRAVQLYRAWRAALPPEKRAVGHHPPEVLDNIHELVNYGLVELEANGQAKRPVLWYDEIGVPLTRLADASDDTVVA